MVTAYLLMGGAFLLGLIAQRRVTSAFKQMSAVPAGLTGFEAARRMLDREGLSGVGIEEIGGRLSDHYDPRSKVLRLSSEVYRGHSMASVGVACHEAGHALQDAKLRSPGDSQSCCAFGKFRIRNGHGPHYVGGLYWNDGVDHGRRDSLHGSRRIPIGESASGIRRSCVLEELLVDQGMISPNEEPLCREGPERRCVYLRCRNRAVDRYVGVLRVTGE